MVIFHGYVNIYQRVSIFIQISQTMQLLKINNVGTSWYHPRKQTW